MTCATTPVALLERAIGWTRQALYDAEGIPLTARTPCTAWNLGDLLAHMSDGLDAFTEASCGFVALGSVPSHTTRIDELRGKACALLAAWTAPSAADVWVHDQALHADVLLHAAAVEITVHGWDVMQTAGLAHDSRSHTLRALPDDLAEGLLPGARLLLASADRPGRFAPALETAYDATPGERLLAHLGRPVSGRTERKGPFPIRKR
ncbi:TIGR03086 family protein [Nocardioides daejeonensis]|uniref:TIGR03086 family protein n=1 Tax=Nocardioides daejeonensis TaxID=1046556 RepID=UPI000D744571|nr:TIGR03086 family protein [Nocardioides daejeonensis]